MNAAGLSVGDMMRNTVTGEVAPVLEIIQNEFQGVRKTYVKIGEHRYDFKRKSERDQWEVYNSDKRNK